MAEKLERYAEILKSLSSPVGLEPNDLVRLVLKGIVTELADDGSQDAVDVLKQAILYSPLPEIQEISLRFMVRLAVSQNSSAVNGLFQLANHHGHPDAVLAIRTHALIPGQPEENALFLLLFAPFSDYAKFDPAYQLLAQSYFSVLPFNLQEKVQRVLRYNKQDNLADILKYLTDPDSTGCTQLIAQYSRFNSIERELVLDILSRQANQGSPAAQDTLCRLLIEYDDQRALEIVLANQYTAADPANQALFYFLTGQWEKYQAFDFSYRNLATAYETASPDLRRRLLGLSRYTGQIAWMDQIPRTHNTRWLRDLTDADWQHITQQLLISNRFPDLWRLAQAAPAVWSAKILVALNDSAWRPTSSDEIGGFNLLQSAAAECIICQPEITSFKTFKSPGKDITAFALQPAGREIACGGSDSSIYTWDLDGSSWLPVQLLGPIRQTRVLAYDLTGEHLTCASGDHNIRVYRRKDFSLIKTLEGHTAQIRSLVLHPDSRTLYSAGFDRTIRSWRFPAGPQLQTIYNGQAEIFGLHLSAEGDILTAAGPDRAIRVWSLPSAALLHQSAPLPAGITAIAGSSQQWIACYTSDQTIHFYNMDSARPIRAPMMCDRPYLHLAFHPGEQFLFGIARDGQITCFNILTGGQYLFPHRHTHPGSGLGVTPSGNSLISAALDGEIVFWDLEPYVLLHAIIAENLIQVLETTQKLLRSDSIGLSNRTWIKFLNSLLAWRSRFDILIEEQPAVLTIGEYDIQL